MVRTSTMDESTTEARVGFVKVEIEHDAGGLATHSRKRDGDLPLSRSVQRDFLTPRVNYIRRTRRSDRNRMRHTRACVHAAD